VLEQLRAFARQQQAAPDSIKQLEREIALEVCDLARQRGLGDVQLFGCPGNAAGISDGHESSHFPKVHSPGSLCLICIRYQNNYSLDA
jgi:hypothetical protein